MPADTQLKWHSMRHHFPVLLVLSLSLAACDKGKPIVSKASVILPEAPGITTTSRVTYRGLDVGRVLETHIRTDGVEIVIGIERTDLRLRRDDQARIQSAALLTGESNIEILPALVNSPPLEANQRLAPATAPSISAQDVLNALRAVATSKPTTTPTPQPPK
jgi:ABC-type transporter Mla subunit MlaD